MTGWLKEKKRIFSQFWEILEEVGRLEVPNHSLTGLVSGEDSLCGLHMVLPLYALTWPSLGPGAWREGARINLFL